MFYVAIREKGSGRDADIYEFDNREDAQSLFEEANKDPRVECIFGSKSKEPKWKIEDSKAIN